MYRSNADNYVTLSRDIRSNPQFQKEVYPTLPSEYTTANYYLGSVGGDYRNNLSPYGAVVNGTDGIANMALTPEDNGFGVASVYRNDRNLGARSNPQSHGEAYQALHNRYTAGDSSFVPAGGDYRNNLSPYGTVVNGADGIANMALTPEDNGFGVASVYRNTELNNIPMSSRRNLQSHSKAYPASQSGYTADDLFLYHTGGDYNNYLSPYGGVVNGIEDYSQRRLTEEELEELRKRYGYGWF